MSKTFEVTRDNERLLNLLKGIKKVPDNLTHLSGVNAYETVDADGVAGLDVVLGSVQGVDGRKPKTISIATHRDLRPQEKNGRIYRADIAMIDDDLKLIRPRSGEGTALRFITTGLLVAPDGTTNRDFRSLMGQKLRYHGAFPLTADAAEVIGEGVDFQVSAQSTVIVDERFGQIRGLPGVPRAREIGIVGVIGGPVLVGQINGMLKISELTKDGWKDHDVTDSAHWQQMFMDLAMTDATYLADLANAKKLRQRRKVKITRGPPSDHPDA